jgi:hypothetical protein
MPERNPYLILGVDFGASRQDARRHFAHAARRIRREGGLWTKEDLTWALHEVESLETNPADTVDIFRVPADPTAFDPVGEGLYSPPPVPLPRRSAPTTPDEIAALEVAAARSLVWTALATCGPRVDSPRLVYRFQKEPQP